MSLKIVVKRLGGWIATKIKGSMKVSACTFSLLIFTLGGALTKSRLSRGELAPKRVCRIANLLEATMHEYSAIQ